LITCGFGFATKTKSAADGRGCPQIKKNVLNEKKFFAAFLALVSYPRLSAFIRG